MVTDFVTERERRKNNEEKFSLNIPFGSKILIENNQNVKANQLLADWDPFTLPIIAEKNGFIKVDLALGKGKKSFDKRKKITKKQHSKEMKDY